MAGQSVSESDTVSLSTATEPLTTPGAIDRNLELRPLRGVSGTVDAGDAQRAARAFRGSIRLRNRTRLPSWSAATDPSAAPGSESKFGIRGPSETVGTRARDEWRGRVGRAVRDRARRSAIEPRGDATAPRGRGKRPRWSPRGPRSTAEGGGIDWPSAEGTAPDSTR